MVIQSNLTFLGEGIFTEGLRYFLKNNWNLTKNMFLALKSKFYQFGSPSL
jgi:hypothetical protein